MAQPANDAVTGTHDPVPIRCTPKAAVINEFANRKSLGGWFLAGFVARHAPTHSSFNESWQACNESDVQIPTYVNARADSLHDGCESVTRGRLVTANPFGSGIPASANLPLARR